MKNRRIIDPCPECGGNSGSWGPRIEQPEGYYHPECWNRKMEREREIYRNALERILEIVSVDEAHMIAEAAFSITKRLDR